MNEYENLIEKLKISIGYSKIENEYSFTDEQIQSYIQTAVLEYSKYKPIIRITEIHTKPYVNIYHFASDYQTWIYGLQDYEIVDGKLYIENNLKNKIIKYKYYADRDLFEIPQSDLLLVVDYCYYLILNDILLSKSSTNFINNDNISAFKLGKGIDLSFDNSQALEKQLYAIAETKKNNFYNSFKNNVIGSWF